MQFDLGAELRKVREARKLSLRAVASAVGVSASLLSQVETGKTQPSVSTLYSLVNFLGISLDSLMGHPGTSGAPLGLRQADDGQPRDPARASDSVVQRREDNPVIEMENGVTWERLSVGETAIADPLIVTYQPQGSSSVEGKMMRHAATEYGVLLEGTLTLRIEFDRYVIEPGDSFCFDAIKPHMYVNEGDVPARGIWFVIARKDITIESLDQLDHEHDHGVDAATSTKAPASAVDVLQVMRGLRTDRP
ncbi:XRE family transcriptional regulator [Microcella alkaliphila]|uniref:XRE family transcriptional regulator n=1 Tax=Microcella alkaliphila TaxID=279828 RepID=A0A4Q7TAE4_9MICO|nr:helix-turn-helix domain-containing protein [Microcella alkaliphila]RZT57391.1 XRE family transcriptional regulator [Microcella alkaliphila]